VAFHHFKQNKTMLKEFKAFIMRGNVLELAVAVIIAGAFGAIVASFTKDIIMPPIGMLLGGVDFTDLALTLSAAEMNDAGEVVKEAVQIRYGVFIQKVIDFVIIAFVIFMLVRTYNKMQERNKKEEEAAPAPPPGPSAEDLLTEIRDLLKKQ
jgi:large conductance mechanosensitive channel